jgi:hypothetical protein
MSYNPQNPNGQATSANSAPVVIASDQSAVPVSVSGGATSANQTNATQKTQLVDGSGNVISAASNALNVSMATTSPSLTIDTENIVVKDDFSGTSINSSNWTVTQKGGTATTYSVANSLLTINAQTQANDYIAFTSTKTFTLPFRVQFLMSASQRIANNNLYLELVNASGITTTALATTAVTSGTTQVAYAMTSTTATTGNVVAQNQGVKSTADTAVTIATTASYSVYEIDGYIDAVDFSTRTTDVASAQAANSTMRQRTVLDPGEAYYVQIRSLNSATAPASNTAFNIEAVVIQNTTDTVVAVSGGRGNNAADRAVPVTVENTTTVSSSGTATVTPASITGVTGSITTSSTSVVSVSTNSLGGYAEVSIHGTYAGISFSITVSDDGGTTYYNTPVYDSIAEQWLAPGATITPATNASRQYWVALPPVTAIVKVLSSAFTSGTGSIRILTGYLSNSPGSTMAQLMDAAGNARGANVTASNQLNVIGPSTSAINAAPPASATQVGGVAATALPTAYTATDLTPHMTDKFGRLVTINQGMRDIVSPMTQLTLNTTTTETTLVAAVASTFNDLLSLVVINTSATATQVDFRDSTGGTVRLSLYIPAGETRGVALNTPMPQSAVNNAWTARCGVAVGSIIITGNYISNK